MSRTRTLIAAAFGAALLAILTLPAYAGSNDHRVRADLECGCLASGKADYRERDRKGRIEQRFSVEVEDAAPGEMWQVHVNDMLVGIIVTDEFGFGELQFRTAAFIDDPGDGNPIPDGFPTLLDGDSITVGPLAGSFGLD
jgi:hypothetical protein